MHTGCAALLAVCAAGFTGGTYVHAVYVAVYARQEREGFVHVFGSLAQVVCTTLCMPLLQFCGVRDCVCMAAKALVHVSGVCR